MANDLKLDNTQYVRFGSIAKTEQQWKDMANNYFEDRKDLYAEEEQDKAKYIPKLGEYIYIKDDSTNDILYYIIGNGELPLILDGEFNPNLEKSKSSKHLGILKFGGKEYNGSSPEDVEITAADLGLDTPFDYKGKYDESKTYVAGDVCTFEDEKNVEKVYDGEDWINLGNDTHEERITALENEIGINLENPSSETLTSRIEALEEFTGNTSTEEGGGLAQSVMNTVLNEENAVLPDNDETMPFDPNELAAADKNKLVTQGALIERLAYNSEGVRAKYSLSKQSGWRRVLNIIRDSCGSLYLSLALGAPTASKKENRLLIENGGSIQTVGIDFNAFVKYFNDTTKEGSPEIIQKFNKIFGTDERAKYQSRISKIRIGYPKYGTSFESTGNNDPTSIDNKYNPINCYLDVYVEGQFKPGGYDGKPNLSVVYYGPTNNHNSDVILNESLDSLDKGIYNEELEFHEISLFFKESQNNNITQIKNTGIIKRNKKTLSSINIPKEGEYFGINTYKRFNMLPLGLNSGGFTNFLNQGIQNFINVQITYDNYIKATIKPSGIIKSTSNRGTEFTTTSLTTPVFIPRGRYLTNLYKMSFQDGTSITVTNLPGSNGNHQYYAFWENEQDRVLTKSTMSFMNCYPYRGGDGESPYYIFPYLIPYKEEYGEKILNSAGKITTKYEHFEIAYDENNDTISFIENGIVYKISDYRDLYSQPYSTHYTNENAILNFKTLQCENTEIISNNTNTSSNYIKDPFWRYKEILNNNYDSIIVTTGSEKNDTIHTEAILSFDSEKINVNNPYTQTEESASQTIEVVNALLNSELIIKTKGPTGAGAIFSCSAGNSSDNFSPDQKYKVTSKEGNFIYFNNSKEYYCDMVGDSNTVSSVLLNQYYDVFIEELQDPAGGFENNYIFQLVTTQKGAIANQLVNIDGNLYYSDENGEVKGIVFDGTSISIESASTGITVEVTYQKDINATINNLIARIEALENK